MASGASISMFCASLHPIVIKMNFPAKTGPETANSPCFLPVIREYQGAKPLSNPGLILPSSLPSKLGWSPGDLRCVNALASRGRGTARRAVEGRSARHGGSCDDDSAAVHKIVRADGVSA